MTLSVHWWVCSGGAENLANDVQEWEGSKIRASLIRAAKPK